MTYMNLASILARLIDQEQSEVNTHGSFQGRSSKSLALLRISSPPWL
jgi:hypothetical protein